MLFSVYCDAKIAKRLTQLVIGILEGVSQYTLGTGELKSVVVLSNAQLYKRGLLIYNWVHEVPFDIPQGYMKGRFIHRQYMEEARRPWVAVQAINENSYILQRQNMSLTYHSSY